MSFTARNLSDPSVAVLLTGNVVTSTCKSGTNPTCPAGDLDPGTFQVLSVVSGANDACAGLTFTVGSPNPTTGEIQLTPSSPIVLGPAPEVSTECRRNMQLRANKRPSNPSTPGTGLTYFIDRVLFCFE